MICVHELSDFRYIEDYYTGFMLGTCNYTCTTLLVSLSDIWRDTGSTFHKGKGWCHGKKVRNSSMAYSTRLRLTKDRPVVAGNRLLENTG